MSVIYSADRDTETVEQYFFLLSLCVFFFIPSAIHLLSHVNVVSFFVSDERWYDDFVEIVLRSVFGREPHRCRGKKYPRLWTSRWCVAALTCLHGRQNDKQEDHAPLRQRGTGRNTFPLQVFTFGFSSICLKPNFFTSVVLLPAPSPLFLPRLPNTRPLCKLYNQQEGRRKKKKERAKT